MAWIEKFIDRLAGLLKEPPYLLFLFIGAVLVSFSLISQQSFSQVWMFFLYSVGGTVWRYIEKDFVGKSFIGEDKDEKENKDFIQKPSYRRMIVSIYHLGNVGLFVALLRYLGFI